MHRLREASSQGNMSGGSVHGWALHKRHMLWRGERGLMLFILAANPFDDPTTRWMLVCAGGLTLIYMLIRPGARKKKDPLSKMAPSSLSQQRAVEREMTQLLVELSEMSRQISAQLDTRAMKLELLIKDADERLARLEAMSPQVSPDIRIAAEEALAPESAPVGPVQERQENRSEARYQAIYALADQGAGVADIARQLDRPRGEIELILALRAKAAS